MMASRRPRGAGSSFASRRGHSNKLSISDTSHHITETIGTMYGDDDDDQSNDARPLSFVAGPRSGESLPERRHPDEHPLRLVRTTSDQSRSHGSGPNGNTSSVSQPPLRMPSQRSMTRTTSNDGSSSPISPLGPMSPTLRDMRDGPESYPLTNIDNPNDIAQELSNLQALRRLSMDVSNNSDPDLLPFQGMSLMAMPSVAPRGDDDADPSRLLWVPAGVHPELAPGEFKSFVEKRVQTMKRRSGESSLSADGLERSNSGSLRRKKSMLSRQIDNVGGRGAEGYVDGAERLERKKSEREPGQTSPEFSLDELMNDPTKAVQKLTLESQSGDGASSMQDMPILPAAPGMGLRRSTRTTYRKGGSLKNRHGLSHEPFHKRMAAKKADGGFKEPPSPEPPSMNAPPGHGLVRVQSEPISENFSRPTSTRSVRRQAAYTKDQAADRYESGPHDDASDPGQNMSSKPSGPRRQPSGEAARSSTPVPQIIETPAIEEESPMQAPENARPFPERSSSQRGAAQAMSQPSPMPAEPPARSAKRSNYGQPLQSSSHSQANNANQPTLSQSGSNHASNDMTKPSPLPGASANRTDTLTFIPTFSSSGEEKKPDKKSKKDKGDSDGSSSKTASWKWFKSDKSDKGDKNDDKDKKKKDADENRKSRTKAFVEKAQDNVRLDVLQTSIDTALHRGRESLLLDRDSIDSKLEEERRKESSRKSGEPKKEKDGIFASFFGTKKRGDRDSMSRKSQSLRPISPEPVPYQPLTPDVDYNWTRFPILEERAIYRMAHIKLANPRRALYSQVLLSNFMYSYLAKVQAMHPQIQVPQSPQQRRLREEERRRREQEQEQQYYEQQQAQDSIDRYNFEYHRSTSQYADPSMQHEAGDYPEAAEIYDYDHNKDHMSHDGDYQDMDDYDSQKDYYSSYQNQNNHGHHQEEEQGMW
ncbi:hypothetical protein GGR56DRAFT_418651 [Xylariaceae sp. FL0804]|nr:hypothetical protein GGR56DRAFT_418651 [Xylariaceae sp. FL0804]